MKYTDREITFLAIVIGIIFVWIWRAMKNAVHYPDDYED